MLYTTKPHDILCVPIKIYNFNTNCYVLSVSKFSMQPPRRRNNILRTDRNWTETTHTSTEILLILMKDRVLQDQEAL